jgi:hypothetical protein
MALAAIHHHDDVLVRGPRDVDDLQTEAGRNDLCLLGRRLCLSGLGPNEARGLHHRRRDRRIVPACRLQRRLSGPLPQRRPGHALAPAGGEHPLEPARAPWPPLEPARQRVVAGDPGGAGTRSAATPGDARAPRKGTPRPMRTLIAPAATQGFPPQSAKMENEGEVLGIRCSGARCSVLGAGEFDPNTEHRTPNTKHQTPNTQHLNT